MTEVATNYNINKTGVTTHNRKMEGLQSAEVDAILKMLKDDKIWQSMEKFSCDVKDKVMVGAGGGPASVVNLAMLGVVPAAVVTLPDPVVTLPDPEMVDSNDLLAINVAKWAVETNNGQTGLNRTFVRLLGGGLKWKFDSGTIYALRINNRDDQRVDISKAVVFEQAETVSKILVSWAD